MPRLPGADRAPAPQSTRCQRTQPASFENLYQALKAQWPYAAWGCRVPDINIPSMIAMMKSAGTSPNKWPCSAVSLND